MNLPFYLILGIVTFSKSPFTSAEWLECELPKFFETLLGDNKKAFVYEPDVQLNFNRNDLAIYNYPNDEIIDFRIHNASLSFSGLIEVDNETYYDDTILTPRIFNLEIVGSARLEKNDDNSSTVADCNALSRRRTNQNHLTVNDKVQFDVIDRLPPCVRSLICQQLDSIVTDRSLNDNHHSELLPDRYFQSVKDFKDEPPTQNCNSTDSSRPNILFQSALNAVVDLGILEVVKKVREMNNGVMPLPDLNEKFSWWKMTAEFDAYNGTFRDLTTLSRTEDAVFTKKGLNLIASCGFGLSVADLEYQRFRLKSGLIKVHGNLSANIGGGTLNISIGLDYNQTPCQVVLQDLQVQQVGKLDIKMTGLGALSKLTSKLITWITKKWKDEILTKVEEQFKDAIMKQAHTLNCEKYRDVVVKEFHSLPLNVFG